ncbi:MAG: O-antigen ligase family protein [Rhodospirillales bacterium]|nr:O-antigen ligase family protein [Rhodospirillales bacterium]
MAGNGRNDTAHGRHWRGNAAVAGAVALGVAVPLIVAGRATLAVVAVLALAGLAFALPRARLIGGINGAFRTSLGRAVWLTLAIWLVAVFASPDIAESARIWLRMVALLMLATVFGVILRERPDLNRLVHRALVAGGCVCVALGLVAVLVTPELFASLRGYGDDLHVHNIAAGVLKHYGTAVACMMPVVLWAGWREGVPRGGPWRLAAIVFQVLAVALLFTLNNRSGLGAGGLGLGVMGAWLAWRQLGLKGLLAVACIPAVLIVAVMLDSVRNNQIEPVLGLPLWLIDAHRQAIWAFALSQFGDNPLFGLGINMLPTVDGATQIVEGSTAEILPSHPHNAAIEVLVETGAVGFAAMAATLVLLLAGGLRALRRQDAAGAALLGLSVAFWFASLLSYSFWSLWWQATYVLLLPPVIAALPPGLVSSVLREPKTS